LQHWQLNSHPERRYAYLSIFDHSRFLWGRFDYLQVDMAADNCKDDFNSRWVMQSEIML
jgi:hypothetical protein